MPCLLDNERVSMIIEDVENDSSHVSFRLTDLLLMEETLEAAETNDKIRSCLEEARDLWEKFQDKVQEFQDIVVEGDDTEYFESGAFSNMGWVMVSRFVRNSIQIPLETLESYVAHRTKKDPRMKGAITRLIRQGLIQRSRVLYPTTRGFCSTESVVICISLTKVGLERCDDDSFIYSPVMTDGKRVCNLNTDNVVPFKRDNSGKTDA